MSDVDLLFTEVVFCYIWIYCEERETMEYTSSSEASTSRQRLYYCEQPMVVKTTRSEHNFGRRFMGCKNYKATSMFYDLGFQKFGQFVEHVISCLELSVLCLGFENLGNLLNMYFLFRVVIFVVGSFRFNL